VRPTAVVLGFVLGSAAAIAFSLVGTVVVFMLLRSEYPQLGAEISALLTSAGLFALLTLVAAISFYGEIKARVWRHAAVAALLLVLLAVAGYHGLLT
jgi:hypothetical protein